MLGKGNGVQIWVRPDTRDTFQRIQQTTGESQVQLTARLAEQEQRRLARAATRNRAGEADLLK